MALFGEAITEESVRDRIAFLMMRLPRVAHLVAAYSEIADMDLGMFMFLLEKKTELLQQAKGNDR